MNKTPEPTTQPITALYKPIENLLKKKISNITTELNRINQPTRRTYTTKTSSDFLRTTPTENDYPITIKITV